jgi:hypothetical protein
VKQALDKKETSSPPRNLAAGYRPRSRAMPISIQKELRHRGEPLVAYPGADLWTAAGGSVGVTALIKDLYRRIEQDKVLRVAFPHFDTNTATSAPKRLLRGCAACGKRSLPAVSTRSRSCGRWRASRRP